MHSYTTRSINIISLIISVIIFALLEISFQPIQEKTITPKDKSDELIIEEVTKIATENEQEIKQDEWSIEIPAIGLKAPISEGTNSETLQRYVGHFEETSKNDGNIGLAGHNRGYECNYFENLKNLKQKDEIYYNYEGKQRKYIVDRMEIIKDTDWSYLQNTKEDKITLITCVENKPQFRRCIQGIRFEGGD